MAELSREVTHRVKSSTSVQSAAATHASAAGQAIAKMFGEEAGKAAETMLRSVGPVLREVTTVMETAERNLAAELGDDVGVRDERDAATTALRDTVVTEKARIREGTSDTYPALVGATGETPEDPTELVRFAVALADGLEKNPAPASTRFEGFTYPSAAVAARLRSGSTRLREALDAFARDAKENDAARQKRDSAIAAYDAVFSPSANITSAVLRAAGMGDLARKVRPSTRRPGVTEGVEDDGSGT